MNLSGNTILITGGASGVGRGLATAFRARGNRVIIAGCSAALLDEITRINPGLDSVELDITDPEDIAAVAGTLVKRFPNLNVIVNNAGFMPLDDAGGTIDVSLANETVSTNLLGPVLLTSALIEHLKSQPSASVIYNCAILPDTAIAQAAIYSASKAAIHSYAVSQRLVLRENNVRVYEIAPPWVDTELVEMSEYFRAIQLDAYIKEVMDGLSSDAAQLLNEAGAVRKNASLEEDSWIDQFSHFLLRKT